MVRRNYTMSFKCTYIVDIRSPLGAYRRTYMGGHWSTREHAPKPTQTALYLLLSQHGGNPKGYKAANEQVSVVFPFVSTTLTAVAILIKEEAGTAKWGSGTRLAPS